MFGIWSGLCIATIGVFDGKESIGWLWEDEWSLRSAASLGG